eukprot:PhF_6_TR8734/c0_g1_i1/m.13735/K11583/PPP2R3; serine/threonine-protein phosphatase 2A regulatory subunit B''
MAFYQSTMLPVDGLSSGNTQSAAMKLNELFFLWMTLPETKEFVDIVVAEALKEGGVHSLGVDIPHGGGHGTHHASHHSPQHPHSNSPNSHDSITASPPMSPCRVRHHSSSNNNNSHLINADEMDLAHRAGAISPRAQSPTSPTRQHQQAVSAAQQLFRSNNSTTPPPGTNTTPTPTTTPATTTSNVELPIPSAGVVAAQQPTPKPQQQQHHPTAPTPTPPTALVPNRRSANEHDIPTFYFPAGKENTRAKDKAIAPPTQDVATVLHNSFQRASLTSSSGSASVQKKKGLFSSTKTTVTPTSGKSAGTTKADVKGGKGSLIQDVAGAFQVPRWLGGIVGQRILEWDQTNGNAGGGGGQVTLEMAKGYFDAYLQGKSTTWRLWHVIRQDPTRPYWIPADLFAVVKELLRVHPGLEFLKQTPEFMDKYAETVVIRIFYGLDNVGNSKVTFTQLEHSTLPGVMHKLDEEDDINVIREYFSYEHFYVLYCKFWELDNDRDGLIVRQDLIKYGGSCVSGKAIDRIVQGYARKLSSNKPGKLNFEDFVWFCISEEDKSTPQSLSYWFKVVDLDGDGILSGHEMDVFLQDQKNRMIQMSIEAIAIEDIVCQMIDMLKPKDPKNITLRDFKACPTGGVFFNVLMNLNKFLIFEQRDPFQAHAEKQLPEKTDWERFARQEYDRMAMEADGGDDDIGGSWK